MRANSPRDSGSRSARLHLLRLNKHRNNSTSLQTERAVANDTQDRRDLARVGSHAHKGLLLGAAREEHVAQRGRTTNVLGTAGLGGDAVPQLVVLGEALLDAPARELLLDVGLAAAVVAGVDADALAEEFLDLGLEGGGLAGQV